ncbi:hybrid sensor histidine kinase/response regulator [Pseudanabaena sp. lw0831]|uniref:hybrid sensor histidine kinase/response regulator n=1 Tax=Pseudanabaena sp. lw0831 TaxID=1357935 RepID=UPI0019163B6F|nr:ATP-binding protein [Pseudanabaena sp. lw0831]
MIVGKYLVTIKKTEPEAVPPAAQAVQLLGVLYLIVPSYLELKSLIHSRQFKFPMVNDELMVDDMMEFADEDEISQVSSHSLESWKVLIVDDEVEIHNITRLALQDFSFDNKRLHFLSAYSGAESRQMMTDNPDIAVILLDVIMESDDAGLITAKYIRETLQNRAMRIILRTGQPGQVPERQAIIDYDIDDYKTKTEFTSQKLFTTIITALRSYKAYKSLESLNVNLERTNVELIRVTKLKDEFLSNMSHELRTPLNGILGMAECLHEEIFGAINPSQKDAIATIQSSGNHLLELIQDMLDVSKLMAGMLKLDIKTVAIADLCNSSLEVVKQKAIKKQIQLTMTISSNLEVIKIEIDERRFRQVLINLLDNAIKFTHSGGKVSLDVRMESKKADDTLAMLDCISWIDLSVTDTDIGISQGDRDKLFKPFIQLDSGLSRNYEGSGLGLVIVKQIVELHGGSIDFSSQIGQGSCFTVRMPYRNTLPRSYSALHSTLNQ